MRAAIVWMASIVGAAAGLFACQCPAVSPFFYGPDAPTSPDATGFDDEPLLAPGLSPADRAAAVKSWRDDREEFESVEAVKKVVDGQGTVAVRGGVGPVYNSNSCVACHHNVVTGNASQVAVLRASHREASGDIVEPPGGSLLFQRAVDPTIQVRLPEGFEQHTLRMATSVLGDGLIECISDDDIFAVQAKQPTSMQGSIILAPVVVGPDGKGGFTFKERVGRFGWKAQDASLMNFAAGAYLNEMGITNPLQPVENTSLGRSVDFANRDNGIDGISDEAEAGHPFGEDTEKFARFMRGTKGPPADAHPASPESVARGRKIFLENACMSCAVCHVPKWTTGREGADIGDINVPKSHAGKTIEVYSDFMLHDIGTGDGIVQTQHAQRPPRGCEVNANIRAYSKAPTSQRVIRVQPEMYNYQHKEGGEGVAPKAAVKSAADPRAEVAPVDYGRNLQRYFDASLPLSKTATMIKTSPLWGLRSRPQLMHDGLSLTVEDAILRHNANDAKDVARGYRALTTQEKADLIAFLLSL